MSDPKSWSGLPRAGDDVEDPISVHHFGLEVQSLEMALFSECTFIDHETEIITWSSTNKEGTVYRQMVPGNGKWTSVTLTRGITKDNKLFEWRQQVIDGKMKDARKDATITGYSPDKTIVMQYVLHRAWPAKYQGAKWDAKAGNTAATEQVVLAHEGARRTK